jgi:hypothetical protein
LEKIKTLTMKKILIFSLILVITSAAASAQVRPQGTFPNNRQLTRYEKKELRRDIARNHFIMVTPMERRRLRRSKCETRRDLIRFRHNGRRRLI